MATLVSGGGAALRMLDPGFAFSDQLSEIELATGTQITIRTPNGRHQTYFGSFVYDDDGFIVSGFTNQLSENIDAGQLIYSITGFFMSVDQFADFLLSNNAEGQRNFIFGGNDSITGSFLSDELAAFGGDDSITGAGGDDTIYGGAGNDTAFFSGNRSDYVITKGFGFVTVTDQRGIDGTDRLQDVEFMNFNGITMAGNRVPSVILMTLTPPHGTTSLAAADFISVSDPDSSDTLEVQILDATVGNGRFRINGVEQAENQIITLSAAQLSTLDFRTSATGSDTLRVRAYDQVTWSDWQVTTISAVANLVPVVTVANITLPKGSSFHAGASLFTVSDGDGDAITTYRFFDGTAGNGRFQLNGVDQIELANIEIDASDLANFRYRSSGTGSDVLWVQAYDGFAWSTWKSFTVAAPVNNAPVASVNTGSLNPAKGTATIAASSFFSVTDSDGDTITQYRFFDGTAGSGRFELNGTQQVELSNITISAADLANFRFRLGGGSDVLWVQAFDGTSWSTWQSFTVQPPANIAPVASINTGSLNPAKGTTTIAAANFFNATDGDGDTITQYKFFDGTTGNGRFELNGVQQAEQANITVDAADLANFRFRLGTGNDTLWVQAFDGTSWSTWQSFVVSAPANVAPTVNVQTLNPAKTDTFIAGSALFTVTDSDDASMAKYRFFDGNTGNGRFQLNGADQAELANIEIDAADLANFRYRTSTTGAGDLLWVQAFDGTAWGAWKSFMANAPVNIAPTVNVQALNPAKTDTFIAGSALFTVSDPDDASMTKYRFFDGNTDNGRFQLNGADQAELANIEINASDLANFRYRTSTTGAGDLLWVQAFDGFAWGAWKSFMVSAPVNVAPVVNVQTVNPTKTTAFIAGANLFTVTDPDDSTIARVRFFDGTIGNGRFQLNGADQAEQANIEIDAADLANFRYRTSTTGAGDTLWVQVYDGFAWSAWKSFTANAPQNVAPVITINMSNLNPVKGAGFISVPSFFTASDPDGDQITLLRFFDGTVGNGYFDFNYGTAQPELQNITIAVADMYKMNYVSSTNGSGDTLWVQAYDGMNWGAWQSFNVAAQFNLVPSVRVFDLFPWVGLNTISGGALFTVDDDDAPVRYRFFDGTVGNGRFQLNGVNQVENQNITVEAADLANFRFATSTTGSDVLWVQVYDGFFWSTWKSFTVAAQAGDPPSGGGGSGGIIVHGHFDEVAEPVFSFDPLQGDGSAYAPVVTATNADVGASTVTSLASLLSASDPDGDAITAWQVWDSSPGGGAVRIGGVDQPEIQPIDVIADQLAAASFVSSGGPRIDTLWARASDGTHWGAWQKLTLTTLAG